MSDGWFVENTALRAALEEDEPNVARVAGWLTPAERTAMIEACVRVISACRAVTRDASPSGADESGSPGA